MYIKLFSLCLQKLLLLLGLSHHFLFYLVRDQLVDVALIMVKVVKRNICLKITKTPMSLIH